VSNIREIAIFMKKLKKLGLIMVGDDIFLLDARVGVIPAWAIEETVS
jgi:hypothetical protein